jgi:glycosyltransferase involved in cell wall biosynthesis
MRHADALIGVSEFVRNTAIENGYASDRCFAVLNALDASAWGPDVDRSEIRRELGIAPNTVVLTIISRICLWKGHLDLLAALDKVSREFNDFVLIIVGEDDLRAHPGHTSFTDELATLVHELGLEQHVRFTGFQTDVRPLLAASDIYAMPSFEEPFGVVFLEAHAMCKPVVALTNGGTPEAVDRGVSALLSDPGDIDQLAANLLRLMCDPELRESMGEAGRRRVLEYYTPRRLAADVEAVYTQVLSGDEESRRRVPR